MKYILKNKNLIKKYYNIIPNNNNIFIIAYLFAYDLPE